MARFHGTWTEPEGSNVRTSGYGACVHFQRESSSVAVRCSPDTRFLIARFHGTWMGPEGGNVRTSGNGACVHFQPAAVTGLIHLPEFQCSVLDSMDNITPFVTSKNDETILFLTVSAQFLYQAFEEGKVRDFSASFFPIYFARYPLWDGSSQRKEEEVSACFRFQAHRLTTGVSPVRPIAHLAKDPISGFHGNTANL